MIWYTVRDAAKVARVSEPTMRRAIVSGALPAVRPSDRRTMVWWSDVLEWLAKRPKQARSGDR